MKESYINTDEGFSSSVGGDYVEGIFSYSINVEINSGYEIATGAGVALGDLFPTATVVETDNYKISIDSTKRPQQGVLYSGSKWYTVTIDVYFKGYE
jgi:hypothetical protein